MILTVFQFLMGTLHSKICNITLQLHIIPGTTLKCGNIFILGNVPSLLSSYTIGTLLSVHPPLLVTLQDAVTDRRKQNTTAKCYQSRDDSSDNIKSNGRCTCRGRGSSRVHGNWLGKVYTVDIHFYKKFLRSIHSVAKSIQMVKSLLLVSPHCWCIHVFVACMFTVCGGSCAVRKGGGRVHFRWFGAIAASLGWHHTRTLNTCVFHSSQHSCEDWCKLCPTAVACCQQ